MAITGIKASSVTFSSTKTFPPGTRLDEVINNLIRFYDKQINILLTPMKDLPALMVDPDETTRKVAKQRYMQLMEDFKYLKENGKL